MSFTAAGTCTIRANQAGDGSYAAAQQAQQSFGCATSAPSKSVQTIQFTSSAPSGAVVGGSHYAVAATARLRPRGRVLVDASRSGVCTLSAPDGAVPPARASARSTRIRPGTGACLSTAVVRRQPSRPGDLLRHAAAVEPVRGRVVRRLGLRDIRARGHVRRLGGKRRCLHDLRMARSSMIGAGTCIETADQSATRPPGRPRR